MEQRGWKTKVNKKYPKIFVSLMALFKTVLQSLNKVNDTLTTMLWITMFF